MKNQCVTDSHGEKNAVILPIKDYKKMMEELEDVEVVKLEPILLAEIELLESKYNNDKPFPKF